MSLNEALERGKTIIYHTIEAFPISEKEFEQLEYNKILPKEIFTCNLHQLNWNLEYQINKNFIFKKIKTTFQLFQADQEYDLVYFDAFAPSAQPELWGKDFFKKIYQLMSQNSIMTTYCAKGQVKRDLQELGFQIEVLPGPPGKREMTRAKKL